mmetsp:Transcript_40405/g.79835  ORF Transcript_40405/g.79835 Transcript_40405/m.79835 type:complete len:590 (+) Transcript_40405:101-1870(+)
MAKLNGQEGSADNFDGRGSTIIPNHPCAVSEVPSNGHLWLQTGTYHQFSDQDQQSETSAGSAGYKTSDRTPKREKRSQDLVWAFADTDTIKERVRSNIKKSPESYRVEQEYWQTGLAQKIARSPRFENLTLGVIVINAIWIAIDTDYNKAVTLLDASWEFRIADILFFGYFSVELIIRFAAFQRKTRCLCDPWFVFDSCLVMFYFFDPFIMTFAAAVTGGGLDLPTSLLRLFRLFRLTRLVRMMRSLPELLIMIKGMVTAAASVSYTLGLLLVVTYIFAIALAQLSIGTSFREQYFKGVGLSMYTLFIYGTILDSLAGFTDAVREESTICLIVLTVFAIMSALTLMNMLVGVLCEIVSAIAIEEKETLLTEKVKGICIKVIEEIDSNHNGMVSFEEVKKLIDNEEAQRVLQTAKVNIRDLVEVAEHFFHEEGREGQLTLNVFMDMVLDCRASKKASLKDVMVLRRRINSRFRDFRDAMKGAETKIDRLIEKRKAKKEAKKAKLLAAQRQSSPKSPKLGDEASLDVPIATPKSRQTSTEQDAHEASPHKQAEQENVHLACTASAEANIMALSRQQVTGSPMTSVSQTTAD